uniref:Uncharacterized protein n=1 Tax=Glossina austeni TaxID=7395 RepID=A0A1A9V6D0_GLOAU
MLTPAFNVEDLTHLSYMRSKIWAAFLEKLIKSEDGKEIDLADIEKEFENDVESNSGEDCASIEDRDATDKEIEPEVLNNMTNCSRMRLIFNKSGHFPEVSIQDDGSDNEDKHLLVDFVNQTLPIVSEHNRQMKESGLEQILNTFDTQKIEEKVGNWLKNNSMAKENYNELHDTTAVLPRGGKTMDPETDLDSFHSGETARYIRSSRPRRVKSVSSSTMMIKTYCRIESTRKKLHEKYGCHQEYYESHLKAIRTRRMMKMDNCRAHCLDEPTSMTTQRQKVLRRKRHSNSRSRERSLSSDSGTDFKKPYHFRSKRVSPYKKCCTPSMPARRRPQSYSCQRQLPHGRCNHQHMARIANSFSSSSSSGTPTNSKYRKGKQRLNQTSKFYLDSRPSKRESDCNCYSRLKLCAKYKHLTDTSTDEWFVENCSPKKSTKRDKKLENAKPKHPEASAKKSEHKKEKQYCNAKQKVDGKNTTKAIPSNSSVAQKSNYDGDESFTTDGDDDLPLINFFAKKQQKTIKLKPIKCSENTPLTKSSKAKMLELKNGQRSIAMNISKEKGATAEAPKMFTNDSESFISQDHSTANHSNISIASSNFANAECVYNSTAITKSNNIARKRQFTSDYNAENSMKGTSVNNKNKISKKQKMPKTTTVSSTSKLSPCEEVNSSNIIRRRRKLSGHSSEESGRAVVSSTTAFSNESGKETVINNTKGILIYTPCQRSSKDSSDGSFDVTQEHLSSIIGEKAAENFFKYYSGRRRFNSKSKVYFKPPPAEISAPDSDDDVFDCFDKCGDLYESFGNDK